jgi:hypothetical protein
MQRETKVEKRVFIGKSEDLGETRLEPKDTGAEPQPNRNLLPQLEPKIEDEDEDKDSPFPTPYTLFVYRL